jgi:uncharacterized protein (TIGR02996 family)
LTPYPIERFALHGLRQSVHLLGDPVCMYRHWGGRYSVLCMWPKVCPHCGDVSQGTDADALLVAARLADDDTARAAYADWCEEFGKAETAEELRGGCWHRGPSGTAVPDYLFPAMVTRLSAPLVPDAPMIRVVAAFSASSFSQLGAAPFRGSRFSVVRERRGASSRLHVAALPPMLSTPPAFDVTPHVLAHYRGASLVKGGAL